MLTSPAAAVPDVDKRMRFDPRLPGADLMVHDYHHPESEWGCKRAVDRFMADKPDGRGELTDPWGSVMFRRAKMGRP